MPTTSSRDSGSRAASTIATLALLLFVVPGAAYAQDAGGAPAGQESFSKGSGREIVGYVPKSSVSNSATGQSMDSPLSPLHLGRLSLLSFESFYLYDNNYNFSQTDSRNSQAATFRAHAAYSLRRKRSQLTMQYRPYLLASGSNIKGSFESNNLDIHSDFHLSSRWLLLLTESFNMDQGLIPQFGLLPDYQTGNLTKNPYLGTNRRYLENNLGASLEHPLSARTSVAFDFRYQYIRTVVGPNDINVAPDPSFKSVQSLQSLAAGFGWSHAFSASQGIQIHYGYDHRLYSTGGIADLHSLLFTYNWQIRRSLFMQAGAGPAILIPEKPAGAVQAPAWTKSYQGNFAMTKSFEGSSVTFSAARNQDFTGLIGGAFNDRFDLSYARRLNRRWNAVVGAGYVQQGTLSGRGIDGQQVWMRTDYRLSQSWSTFSSVISLRETGGVHTGRRNVIMGGIQWSWRPASSYNSGIGF
jgi:hypothetical protein